MIVVVSMNVLTQTQYVYRKHIGSQQDKYNTQGGTKSIEA